MTVLKTTVLNRGSSSKTVRCATREDGQKSPHQASKMLEKCPHVQTLTIRRRYLTDSVDNCLFNSAVQEGQDELSANGSNR